MSNLLYNSSTDVLISRNDLSYLQTPAAMGSRHAPYSFADFTNTVVDTIESKGFSIVREELAITKDQNRLFGLLEVCKPSTQLVVAGESPDVAPNDWSLLVALRGSHDQKISRGLAIGSRVMVCSNLCFHGDLGIWNTRQTTNINSRIPDLVNSAVNGLGLASHELTIDFDLFNQAQIDKESGDKLLLSIFRDNGFSASQLGRAINDWDSCSIPEHTANGRNIWWLFNSATEALKPTGANNNHNDLQERSTIVFHHLRNAVQHQAPAMLQ